MNIPRVCRIRQKFNTDKIENIEEEIHRQFSAIRVQDIVKPGMRIAVTAGSRGIANIQKIIRTVCEYLKSFGAEPFIVPSMGSHGGATAEGQVRVLEKLGITEKSVGAPVLSSMEVVELGQTSKGVKVYMDKIAYNSDGIVVVNRVKPHTDFSGEIESGLLKMIAVGLGKHKGCSAMHAGGLAATIPEAAGVALNKAPILFGLAILENSRDETYKLKALLPSDFEREEKLLLKEAKTLVPKLPVEELDVLVVQKIGKMYSGTGMDTKVIGRIRVFGEKEPEFPRINKIIALDLDENSYGNALGIGLADITTRRLFDRIDFDVTYANIIPTTYLERGKIPVIMPDDREAIKTALKTIGNLHPEEVKLGIIKNTLHLEELYLTRAAISQVKNRSDIEILEEDLELEFDENNRLKLIWGGDDFEVDAH
ncbi:lactate racemase domain-containing protein [Thermoanaerobacterium sp. DL9XJH110]|uniref:lactate racemase domain-containing protein n=1 Tax=Thermoanaerobacterium sp. DL9XJH110 TaxID=3386643 RepID=UPI003BB48F12